MSPADRYAAHVVRLLKSRGLTEKRAVAAVQSEEALVREAHARGVTASEAASSVIAAHKARTSKAIVGLAKGNATSEGLAGYAAGASMKDFRATGLSTRKRRGTPRLLDAPLRGNDGSILGFDPAAFLAAVPGFAGPAPTVPLSAIVEESGDTCAQPALFLNAEELGARDRELQRAVEVYSNIFLEDERQELFNRARGQSLDPELDRRELEYARYVAAGEAERAKKNLTLYGTRLDAIRSAKDKVADIRKRLKKKIAVTPAEQQLLKDYERVDNLDTSVKEPERIEKQSQRKNIVLRLVDIIKDTYPAAIATNKDHSTWQVRSAIFAEESGNEKISSRFPAEVAKAIPYKARQVATTYAPIERSCPNSCVLKYAPDKPKDIFGNVKRGVCYAQTSNNILPIVLMLDSIVEAFNLRANAIAEDEARAIASGFPNGIDHPIDLRIHTSGDTQTGEGARMLAAAVEVLKGKQKWKQVATAKNSEYMKLGQDGQRMADAAVHRLTQPLQAWSYTHAWMHRGMSREDWGSISCLASANGHDQARKAFEQGWAPTIVVDEGTFKKYAMTPDGFTRAFSFAGDVEVVPRWRRERGATRAILPENAPRVVEGDPLDKNMKRAAQRLEMMSIEDRRGAEWREGVNKVGSERRYLAKGARPSSRDDKAPIMWIPCPAQHPIKEMKVGCVNCRLCMNDRKLWEMGMGIAFEAHGTGKEGAITYGSAEELTAKINARKAKDEKALQAEARRVVRAETAMARERGELPPVEPKKTRAKTAAKSRAKTAAKSRAKTAPKSKPMSTPKSKPMSAPKSRPSTSRSRAKTASGGSKRG